MADGYYDFSGAFANLNNSIDGLRKRRDENERREAMAGLGQDWQAGNYDTAAQRAFSVGDAQTGVGLLKLGEAARVNRQEQEASRSFMGMLSGGPQPSQAQPSAAVGNPTEIENRFIGTVRGAGLTNPFGLGAVAAYGRAESGFSPANANRAWSDPSQSGQPGQAGGIMSWRADRLQNLYRFAQAKGERPGNISPETQAQFLAQEDPELIPRLQSARSPDEANQIMANAWRFAGYDQPGGENARRLAMTQHYSGRFGREAPQGVRVAENEGDVQRLEAEMAARQGAPVQVAQAQADLPAQGAAQAQFVMPGNGLPPNDLAPNVPTQALIAAQANARLPAAQRELAKSIVERRLRFSDENSPLKTENMRLQNEKLRQDVGGKQFRTLTAAERVTSGVPDDYKGVVQVDRDGQLHFPGKPSTEVNIDQKVQSAAEVERAKSNVKFLSGIADSSPALSQRSADIDMLGAVLRDAPTGSGADTRVFLDRVGATLGLSDGQLATRADAINAIVQRIAPTLRQEGSGSTSDIEFKGMLASLPALSNTPEGVQLILSTISRQNEITRMRVEVANSWAAGDLKDGEARKRIAQIDRQSIFASADEKALVRKLTSTKKAGDLGQSSGALERSVGGKTYVMRDGQWFLKEGFN